MIGWGENGYVIYRFTLNKSPAAPLSASMTAARTRIVRSQETLPGISKRAVVPHDVEYVYRPMIPMLNSLFRTCMFVRCVLSRLSAQSPRSRSNERILGTTIPVLGPFWVSDCPALDIFKSTKSLTCFPTCEDVVFTLPPLKSARESIRVSHATIN